VILFNQGGQKLKSASLGSFIGVFEFFAVLLPGGLLTGLVLWWNDNTISGLLEDGQPTTVGWVAILVASYVLGHALHAVGSLTLDELYDEMYAKRYKRASGDDIRLSRTKQLLAGTGVKDTLQWAESVVRLNSVTAIAETERISADSKFFRGVSLVALIALIFPATKVTCAMRMVCLLISIAAFLRFCQLRWKYTKRTYEYFILLYPFCDQCSARLAPTRRSNGRPE
jgi:hypothetical protein